MIALIDRTVPMTAIKEIMIIGSEAVGLDVAGLLSGVI